jgi:hypothetical protein
MGIKINPGQIKDKYENGNFILYFPHDLELSSQPINVKLVEWINYWGFRINKKQDSTEVVIPNSFNLTQCFHFRSKYGYLEGLNKDINDSLNEKDFLNLILCKTFKSMGFVDKSYSIISGFSENEKSTKVKLSPFISTCKLYNYKVDEILYKKDLDLTEEDKKKFIKQEDSVKYFEIKKTKLPIEINGEKNELFYDICALRKIKSRNIFFSNKGEKKEIDFLNKIHSGELININIGSLKFTGNKFKKEEVNYMYDILKQLRINFDNQNLSYNIVSGMVVSQKIDSERFIDLDDIEKIKETPGYYISETFSKLKEYGIVKDNVEDFHSNYLQFKLASSFWFINPNIFLEALINHCDKINDILNNKNFNVYKDNNVRVFLESMFEDLDLGMKKLGLFPIENINL